MNTTGPIFRPNVVTYSQAMKMADEIQACGLRIVLTNGCFDLLHRGHVEYLKMAASLGDCLMVGVNSDVTVGLLKGPGRPLNTCKDRMEVLVALRHVDFVFPFDGFKFTESIRSVRPRIYVKGGDYTLDSLDFGERSAAMEVGAEIRIIPFLEGYSTTSILEKSS